MSQIYAEKRKNVFGAQTTSKSAENISKSDMLRMSGAGAPQPMSASLRETFEPGFGADFSNIRISRGHIPEEMGVQAVAKGTDILVDSRAGMDVIGHELAHVVQQAQGRVQGGYPVVENAALEHEADVMGARVASGMNAELGGMSGMGGEMMSIAPMSGAQAPAQCKSKKDKGKEAPQKSRGDLFKEDYASRDLTGQVELLREYTNVLTGSLNTDKSEEDAYYDLLGSASPELMDELLRQKESAANNLIAQNQTSRFYEDDGDKADFNTALSGEADEWQAFELMMKNLGMGTRNDKAYSYFKEKEMQKMGSDSAFNNLMLRADKLQKEGLSNKWAQANPEVANMRREQWDEAKQENAEKWNASREAMLAPKAAPKKKGFFSKLFGRG